MIYLAITHITDEDSDYYKFNSLHRACEYIITNGCGSWDMSDMPFMEDGLLIEMDRYKMVE